MPCGIWLAKAEHGRCVVVARDETEAEYLAIIVLDATIDRIERVGTADGGPQRRILATQIAS